MAGSPALVVGPSPFEEEKDQRREQRQAHRAEERVARELLATDAHGAEERAMDAAELRG